MAVVKQRDYITVHDGHLYQDHVGDQLKTKFGDADHGNGSGNGNGLAILQPTKAQITEALNGTYELYLEHPISDNDKRWTYLQCDNIIRAKGQLFRICKVGTKMKGKTRTVQAMHIFYDLAAKDLGDLAMDGWTGYWFLKNTYDTIPPNTGVQNFYFRQYDFKYSTDLGANPGPDAPLGYAIFNNANFVSCIIGTENPMTSIYMKTVDGKEITPELYRDNFYFSVNWRKEHAVDDAFKIVHKVDMTDIEFVHDVTDVAQRIFIQDNYGHVFSDSRYPTAEELQGWHPAILREKYVKFQYNNEENNGNIAARFQQDAKRYWQTVKEPKISVKVSYADLSKTELYKDYIAAKHCNVGDTGTVKNEELGIEAKLKVVRKTTDILKDEVDSIEFGNLAATITAPKAMSQTINNSKFNYSEVLPIGNVPNS